HFASTHLRYVRQYLPSMGMDTTEYSPSAMRNSLDDIGISLGNGHSLVEMKQRALPIDRAKDELAAHRELLVEKFGEEHADKVANFNRNLFIFPNLIMISMWRTVRTFYPISPDYMEVDAWPLMPKGE